MPRISFEKEYKDGNGKTSKRINTIYLPDQVFYAGEIYNWDNFSNCYVNGKKTKYVSGEEVAKNLNNSEMEL